MTDYVKTEEEQVAAIKQWWKDNGTSLMVGVVLALGGIFGWKAYQKSTYEAQVAASVAFQNLVDASQGGPLGVSEEQQANVVFLANEIIESDPESAYSVYARLFKARDAQASEDLGQAEALLNDALAVNQEEALAPVIKTRLARVLAQQGSVDEAVALLDASGNEALALYFEEIKGDLLKLADRTEEAVAAYTAALAAAESLGRDGRVIQMKLDDLAGA